MSEVKVKYQGEKAEEKILKAAYRVFHRKGFAATRTRDIALEADINLALINYYFRSKQKLFEVVMLQSFQRFFSGFYVVVNDPATSLHEKMVLICEHYVDSILAEPEIPVFVLNEMRSNPKALFKMVQQVGLFQDSVLARQYREATQAGLIAPFPFEHFFMNLMGMVMFPFLAKPMLGFALDISEEKFEQLIQERKKMIPIWIEHWLLPA